mgnify:CR=1 FL=1
MPHKMKTTQLELFPNTRSTTAAQTPPWQSLPDETRQTLTRLRCTASQQASASEASCLLPFT